MEERIDYKKAYESKKRPEGVYLMIQFCSNIKNSTNIKDIPSILRLYYGRVVTCEQNEFVTEVLNNIVAKNPRDAARIIIDNIRILKEEASFFPSISFQNKQVPDCRTGLRQKLP